MSRIIWYIGNALMFLGLVLVAWAFIVGIWAGQMAQEYLFWALGGGIFLVGGWLRNSSE